MQVINFKYTKISEIRESLFFKLVSWPTITRWNLQIFKVRIFKRILQCIIVNVKSQFCNDLYWIPLKERKAQ